MRNLLFICTIFLFAMSSCIADFPESKNPGPDENAAWNTFDFSTIGTTNLDIRYQDMGGISAPVYFEIYDTCPVRLNDIGSGYVKIEGIEPLFAATTAEDGTFSGQINLPDYMETAYIYTPAFYARTLIEAKISGNKLTATDYVEQIESSETAAEARAKYDTEGVTRDDWKTYLGSYDTSRGKGTINYKYSYSSNSESDLRVKNFAALYKAHSSVININRDCPEDYRSSRDLYIEKEAEIAVTFLGSNTCWNCSMGYYFYRDGECPTSLSEANVILIFPNTQDGEWTAGNVSSKYIGVARGTAVQLKYYSNINDSRSGTTVFPAGYRVGFVLACNAWTNRLPGFTGSKNYRAATSEGLSINDQGTPYTTPRTAVYRYIDPKKDINAVMFSFEDYKSDENFSDVVFTLVSNPIDAVTDLPEVGPGEDESQTVKMLRGIYAFEDLWPSRGDYDMNDVMVKSNYEKVYSEKGIHEESFIFKTYNNFAGLENGLAITLGGPAAATQLTFSIMPPKTGDTEPEFAPAKFTRDGEVILLTDNVKQTVGSTYKVTAKYDAPVQDGGLAKPFIYNINRKDLTPGKRWEMHLPFEAPSAGVDPIYFGRDDDRSDPSRGVYYVRQDMYPFAFFLSGATDADMSSLLDSSNEKTPIDELYPDYSKWVKSNGESNKDWYKK